MSDLSFYVKNPRRALSAVSVRRKKKKGRGKKKRLTES
jgi:hypothetical protein